MHKWERFWAAFDRARTVPRCFLMFYAWQMYKAYDWATGLKDISPAQSAFLSIIYAASVPILQFYMSNGPKQVEDTTIKGKE